MLRFVTGFGLCAAVLALGACQAPDATPAATAAAPAATSAPTASAAAAGMDGTYRGRWTVQRDRTGQCNSPTLPTTEVTVRNGQVTLVNRGLGINGSGRVESDGTVNVTGTMRGGPFRFAARVDGNRMQGQGVNADCAFTADLTRTS